MLEMSCKNVLFQTGDKLNKIMMSCNCLKLA
ncbi:hypothetical protein MAR_009589 [Mya arenaria]|uniref:Uncharacterized protein n=1 Tax=Mya arenaria TaxID=6604 RepID=A0ABY7E3E4_MYAAR|nr:hypothetical protein MAR_009589 [Mya arenaria]